MDIAVLKDMLNLLSTKTVKAVVLLVLVWTVVFSLIIDVDVLTGSRAAGGGVLSDLVHGQQAQQSNTTGNDTAIEVWPEKHDTLIAYVYSESSFGRDNIHFFLQMAMHEAADFIFIFNGEVSVRDSIPDWPNVRVVQRNNTCYDMGALGEVMRTDDLWKNYKKFISINSSLRGPYIPYWSNACWSDMYLNKLNDRVKFVGLTANCWPRAHIQSMIYATDDIGMGILLDPEHATSGIADKYGPADATVGLTGCYSGHKAAVHSEVGLATLFLNAGYEVDAMMAAFDHKVGLVEYCNTTGLGTGDLLSTGQYYDTTIHAYDTLFIKTNRKIDPVGIKRLTEWHLRANITSRELCSAR
ncbi:hypothetical protein SCUCBS95973_005462 [Sporothrix curviconia]|uniref:Uncharacterized protein n=1 Tax=Sporothrix curviconia TaxID=1260050 RepID=A0ABP0BX62_9PEZI